MTKNDVHNSTFTTFAGGLILSTAVGFTLFSSIILAVAFGIWIYQAEMKSLKKFQAKVEAEKQDMIESIDYKSLAALQMFLWNRANYDYFMKAMSESYDNDHQYIEKLWPDFRDNPMGFIIKRNERKLFDYIIKEIKETGYKG